MEVETVPEPPPPVVKKPEVPKEQPAKPAEVKKHETPKETHEPKKPEPVVSKPAPKEPINVATGRALSEHDLKGISKQDLKLMRNEIFARHGYIFKSPELNNYFKQKPWYKPQHEDVNGLLSPEERENVELIKKMER